MISMKKEKKSKSKDLKLVRGKAYTAGFPEDIENMSCGIEYFREWERKLAKQSKEEIEHEAALYVKKNDPRCEQAIKAVKKLGLQCDIVDVVKTGAINYMHRDLGTSEVPVLCVDDGTIAKGLDSIKFYIKNPYKYEVGGVVEIKRKRTSPAHEKGYTEHGKIVARNIGEIHSKESIKYGNIYTIKLHDGAISLSEKELDKADRLVFIGSIEVL